MGIFDKRVNLKPYEYPNLYSYVDAIRNSYWIHTEFNFTSDIQDFHTNLSENERNVITKTLLAIAQIEVSVKTFWGDTYRYIPKPEVSAVGFSFAESEVRHMDAYSHLLEILGLNGEFEKIFDIPAINDRISYLEKIKGNGDYVKSLLLFSLFVEHISLFSQFFIVMGFNKHKNTLKGISNVIEATSKEENLHGLFGSELVNIIKKENPDIFTDDFIDSIYELVHKAYKAEMKILDWIFEGGELDFLPREQINNFLSDRFNGSLKSVGLQPIFSVNEKLLEESEWFNDELNATKHGDFFVKKSVNYNKKGKSITEDDLF